ncbi:MAG TPA: 50S ribosomal protein L25 [Thermodesulfobacteriota bacterium]|nr:50S ribosomal protein L25 [Thermodesulfobacteriota bacterium]
MAQNILEVSIRTKPGKSGAREVRKLGNIPAVLYGKGTEPVLLSVNPAALKQALSTEAGENTLLEITYSDDSNEVKKLSLLREIQYDFLTSKPIHFDFQALDINKKITVDVPVKIVGKSKGVKDGGILEEILREIPVECLPKDIPNSFEIDVTELEIGHSIHVSALKVSEAFDILKDDEETIVTILAPKMEVEAPAAGAEEVPEKAAEGEVKEEGGEE